MSLRSNNPFDTMTGLDVALFMGRLDRYYARSNKLQAIEADMTNVTAVGSDETFNNTNTDRVAAHSAPRSHDDEEEDSKSHTHQEADPHPSIHNGDVDLVVCILLTDYTSWEIWSQWAAETPRIGFVSHPRPEHSDIPYSVDSPLQTAWGTSSLIFAELLLYQTASVRFPAAQHFMLVSGDTVPIQSAAAVLQYYTRFPSTHFLDFSRWASNRIKKVSGTIPPTLHPYQHRPVRRPRKIRYHLADQFKTICRSHVEYLLSASGQAEVSMLSQCTFESPRRIFNASLDEIVIPTILICQFGSSSINDTLFMKVEGDPLMPHPVTICTMAAFTIFWYSGQGQTPDCQMMRKIQKSITGDVLVFLRAKGVLPAHLPVRLADGIVNVSLKTPFLFHRCFECVSETPRITPLKDM
jgi:hypothetical protein